MKYYIYFEVFLFFPQYTFTITIKKKQILNLFQNYFVMEFLSFTTLSIMKNFSENIPLLSKDVHYDIILIITLCINIIDFFSLVGSLFSMAL